MAAMVVDGAICNDLIYYFLLNMIFNICTNFIDFLSEISKSFKKTKEKRSRHPC